MNEETNEDKALLAISSALEQLLVSYKNQNSQSSQILSENQKILATLKTWEAKNQKEAKDIQEESKEQEELKKEVVKLKDELSKLKIPKQPMNMNPWLRFLCILFAVGMVAIAYVKIFDYETAKNNAEQAAEQRVFKELNEDYYTFKKSDYDEVKKEGGYRITPKASK